MSEWHLVNIQEVRNGVTSRHITLPTSVRLLYTRLNVIEWAAWGVGLAASHSVEGDILSSCTSTQTNYSGFQSVNQHVQHRCRDEVGRRRRQQQQSEPSEEHPGDVPTVAARLQIAESAVPGADLRHGEEEGVEGDAPQEDVEQVEVSDNKEEDVLIQERHSMKRYDLNIRLAWYIRTGKITER